MEHMHNKEYVRKKHLLEEKWASFKDGRYWQIRRADELSADVYYLHFN